MELENGYKQTRFGKIPDDWKIAKLGEQGYFFSGLTYSPENVCDEGLLVLRSSNIKGNRLLFEDNVFVDVKISEKLKVKEGDILICVRNGSRQLIGKSALIDKDAEGLTFGAFMSILRTKNYKFIFQVFQSNLLKKQIQDNLGATINQITSKDFNSFKIPLPPLGEQKKIAAILSTWDKSIETTEKIIAAKQKLKKSLMQRLLTGSQRFPEFHGQQWKQIHIGDIAREVSAKNKKDNQLTVLSCTKHKGLVDSLSYFGKQIFSKNLSTYKIVKRGQFAYATNHIEEGSIGYQNLHDEALISPMYTVFQTNAEIDDSFLYKLLKTETYRHIFEAMTSGSINRRGSLRWNHFAQIKLKLPPIEEQKKIAAVLNNCDAEINVLENKLGALRRQKRSLMQKLLTGEVRVEVGKF